MLLDALRDRGSLRGFVPFDVDASMLSTTATAIQGEYPGHRNQGRLRRFRGAPD